MSEVAIVKVKNYDVDKAVKKVMELTDYKKYIKRDDIVVVKPNLCWDLVVPGCQTSPWVMESLLKILIDRCSEVHVIEGDSNTHKAENAIRNTRYDRILKKLGLEFTNLTHAERKRVTIKNPLFFKNGLNIPKIILNADSFVTVPVLKAHGQVTMTGALKNQYGCLENVRATFHLSLNDVIVDINRIIKPTFALMDATIGFEDNSPKLGKPKIMNLTIASSDLVALDATAAYVMGFDPDKIGYLDLANKYSLGENRIDRIKFLGDNLNDVRDPFIPSYGRDWVVKLNILTLKLKFLRPLIYDTLIFDIMTLGATIYNTIWYHRFGVKHLRRIMQTSKYGEQWKD